MLTAIKMDRPQYWCFKCDCGKEVVKYVYHVLSGHTASCGCDSIRRRMLGLFKHGDSINPKGLYNTWAGMKNRCSPKSIKRYPAYSGRGITICPQWMDYMTFKAWALSSGYSKGLTIDRIDPNGNYEPDNCRWATMKMQNNNQRKTRMVSAFGKTQALAFWVLEKNIPYWVLYERIFKKKLSPEEALNKPWTKGMAVSR